MNRRNRYRAGLGIGFLFLSVAALLAIREPATDWMARDYAARRLIRQWKLPRTRAMRRLFHQGLKEPPRPSFNPIRMFPGRPGPSDGPAPFSTRYTHEALRAGGTIRIGVFTEDAMVRDRLYEWAGEPGAIPPGIDLEIRQTRDEFLDALARMDMVFFFGHANLGRGLQLGNTGDEEHFLPLAPPLIELRLADVRPGEDLVELLPNRRARIRGGHAPELAALPTRCKVFWFLGCRTEPYYRNWFEAHFPGTDLVLTRYELDTTSYAVHTLQLVLFALEQRRPISHVIDAMNYGRTLDLLRGMRAEAERYGRTADFSTDLHLASPAP